MCWWLALLLDSSVGPRTVAYQVKGYLTTQMFPLGKGLHLRIALIDVSNLPVLKKKVHLNFINTLWWWSRSCHVKENLPLLFTQSLADLLKLWEFCSWLISIPMNLWKTLAAHPNIFIWWLQRRCKTIFKSKWNRLLGILP